VPSSVVKHQAWGRYPLTSPEKSPERWGLSWLSTWGHTGVRVSRVDVIKRTTGVLLYYRRRTRKAYYLQTRLPG